MPKKTVFRLVFLLLLVGVLTYAFNIQPVGASGTIYIKSDGSIDPPTAPIQALATLAREAKIGVVTTQFTEEPIQENNKSVELRCSCNRELAKSILEEARACARPENLGFQL